MGKMLAIFIELSCHFIFVVIFVTFEWYRQSRQKLWRHNSSQKAKSLVNNNWITSLSIVYEPQYIVNWKFQTSNFEYIAVQP